METAGELRAEHILLAAGIVLAVGSTLGYIARRLHIPDIVLFLGAGITLGPEFLGWINIPAASALSWAIIIFTASYILFDGGATLRLRVLSNIWISLVLIVTVGLVVTAVITGFAAHEILDVPVAVGLLLGAAIASTDPATLIPVFKQVRVKERVAQFVVSESALNDPMGAIATIVMLTLAMGHATSTSMSVGHDLADVFLQAGIGIGVGLALGLLGSLVVAHKQYGFLMEYLPLITLIAVIGSQLGATRLHASGFMAVFAAGLVMGNMRHFGLRMRPGDEARFEDFVHTTSLICRMFIFILLGSQIKLDLIAHYWWQGLLVVFVFMFIARPLTVLVSTLPDRRARWSWQEMAFIAWSRETGVIPGALASMLIGVHAPHADMLAAVIFMGILVTIVLQATTAKWLAGRLGLLLPPPGA